ncbi:hypothetical protein [Catellatospora sp. NPDC049609]|uniref:hypothetical protein n=1 Tax=Catellatospora sp. NPDC049609 TaxID=3155505 RepID=UPI00341699AA
MSEQWRTIAELDAARDRFEAAIPGWERPAAFGVARLVNGEPEFARIAVGDGLLPAVVLGTIVGRSGGSGSYPLSPADLDRAITTLTPAEACTDIPHPNLWAWRSLRERLGDGEQLRAVFATDLAAETDDPYVTAMLGEVAGR